MKYSFIVLLPILLMGCKVNDTTTPAQGPQYYKLTADRLTSYFIIADSIRLESQFENVLANDSEAGYGTYRYWNCNKDSLRVSGDSIFLHIPVPNQTDTSWHCSEKRFDGVEIFALFVNKQYLGVQRAGILEPDSEVVAADHEPDFQFNGDSLTWKQTFIKCYYSLGVIAFNEWVDYGTWGNLDSLQSVVKGIPVNDPQPNSCYLVHHQWVYLRE